MLQLGDKGTTTWFRCLVCSRCYPVEEKLIVHKTTTNCRFHYAKAYKKAKRAHKKLKVWKRTMGYAVSSDHSDTSEDSGTDSDSSSGSVICEAVVPSTSSLSIASAKRRKIFEESLRKQQPPVNDDNEDEEGDSGSEGDDESEDNQDQEISSTTSTITGTQDNAPEDDQEEDLSSAETVLVTVDPNVSSSAAGAVDGTIKTIGGQDFTVTSNGISALGTPSTLLTPVVTDTTVSSEAVSSSSTSTADKKRATKRRIPEPVVSPTPSAAASTSSKSPKVKFDCYFCGEEYSNLASLTRHMRTHTKEKEFQCRGCNRFFTYRHQMEYHQMNSRTCHV